LHPSDALSCALTLSVARHIVAAQRASARLRHAVSDQEEQWILGLFSEVPGVPLPITRWVRVVAAEKTVRGALVDQAAAHGQPKLDPAGVDGSPDHCDDHVVAAATTRVIGSTAGRTLDTDPKADRRARHHPDSTGRFMPARFNYWAGQLAPPKPSTMQ